MALKILSGPLRLGSGGGLQIKTGGAAFTPSSVAGLAAWFKADVGTGQTVDGTAISQWSDQSGNGRHLLQATGAKQPLFKTAIQNGKPVVRFDGIAQYLQSAGFTLNQPMHVFLVAAYRSTTSGDRAIFDGITAFATDLFRPGAANNNYSLFAGSTSDTITTTPQAWHVIGALFNGASSELRADGGTAGTGNPGANNAGGMTLGASGGTPAQFSPADVGELIVYSAALSTANRQAVEAYLKARWGTP